MTPRQSFGGDIELVEAASRPQDVGDIFLAASERYGFEHAALFSVVYPDDPRRISFARVPLTWLARYQERRYYEIDPVFAAVTARNAPFTWNDPSYRKGLTAAQKTLLDETAEAGLAAGVAIPIKKPGAPLACCTLVPSEPLDQANYAAAHSLAVFAHARACQLIGVDVRGPRLSKRERECLLLAARGKSDWTIAELLGLSERTVHHTIERAKRRLGVATRVQAIVHAIGLGEFSAFDAIE